MQDWLEGFNIRKDSFVLLLNRPLIRVCSLGLQSIHNIISRWHYDDSRLHSVVLATFRYSNKVKSWHKPSI